jgi:hypothetical protein
MGLHILITERNAEAPQLETSEVRVGLRHGADHGIPLATILADDGEDALEARDHSHVCRYRVFEAFDEKAGDPVRWIAATTEEDFKAAAQRKGWRAGAEIRPTNIPQDRKGLKQMGVDLIVGEKS